MEVEVYMVMYQEERCFQEAPLLFQGIYQNALPVQKKKQ